MALRLVSTSVAALAAACLSRPAAIGGGGGDGGSGSGIRDGRAVSPDAPGVTNYMFVSAEVFKQPWASSGSPESGSADGACTEWANEAGRPGVYMAWLSYGDGIGNNVVDRLRATAAKNWQLTNGSLFAATVQDIIDTNIAAAPKFDENGQDVGTGTQVATGTTATGVNDAGTAADCPAGSIEVGDPNVTDAGWTASGEVPCSINSLRLYCFGYGPQ